MTVAELFVVNQRVNAGESLASIAREHGIKPDTLHKQYRRVFGAVGYRGPNGGRKVTPCLLKAVRRRVARGERLRTIAKELEINPNTLASAYRRAGYSNPNPGGNKKHWCRIREAELAMRDWRNNARGCKALDWLISDILKRNFPYQYGC